MLGVGSDVGLGGGQGGCDRRIESFGKIHKKKIQGGSVWGVRVDVGTGGGGRGRGRVGGSGWM